MLTVLVQRRSWCPARLSHERILWDHSQRITPPLFQHINTLLRGLRHGTGTSGTKILAIDSTVLPLWELLQKTFPSTIADQAKVKLHIVYNVINGRTGSVQISDGKTSDQTPFKRVGKWVAGHLLLLDLGYYNFSLFTRIDHNEGWFASRAKTNFNGLIVGLNQTVVGRPTDLVGHRVQDVLARLKRGVLDVQVQVEFDKRAYRGKIRRGKAVFRLIGLWNADKGRYHLYLTNLPVEKFDAQGIANLYALRWQIEILMKALQSHHRIHQLPTQNETIVRILIWASLVSLLSSRLLLRFVRDQVLPTRHIPHLRWSALFERMAGDMLRDLLAQRHEQRGGDPYMDFILHEAFDPNRDRFEPRFVLNRC